MYQAKFNPFTAIMPPEDVLRKIGSCMSIGRRMTSGYNPHFSCTPKWSEVFETHTAGQQSFSERLFLEAIFTNGTNALAGKGLKTCSTLLPCIQRDRKMQPSQCPNHTPPVDADAEIKVLLLCRELRTLKGSPI